MHRECRNDATSMGLHSLKFSDERPWDCGKVTALARCRPLRTGVRPAPDVEGFALTTNRPVPVVVHSPDPILREGVIAQLRGRAEVGLTDTDVAGTIAVVVADDLDDETIVICRRVSRDELASVVVILNHLDDVALLAGFEAGVRGFVMRNAAVPERLVPVIVAVARGEVSVPPHLVGGLLLHLSRVQANGGGRDATDRALSPRELDVLRLASEGLETAEIARQLAYSERTVKGVVHDITSRFQLRNRTHAVAFAMKHGLI